MSRARPPKPKIRNISPPRPKWMPNGKIKQSNNSVLYKSTSSINKFSTTPSMYRSTSSINKSSSSLNHNSAKNLWQPSGKVRPKSALFYSSSQQDLRRSTDLRQSLKKTETKDVGKGWKPCGKIENHNKNSIYFAAQEPVVVAEPVVRKKEPVNDPKDIGGGWKKVGKMKEENYFKIDPEFVRVPKSEVAATVPNKTEKDAVRSNSNNLINTS